MIKKGVFIALSLAIGLAVTAPYAWAAALSDVTEPGQVVGVVVVGHGVSSMGGTV